MWDVQDAKMEAAHNFALAGDGGAGRVRAIKAV